MSEWDDNLQPASWNGIDFEVVSVSDSVDRQIVAHRYPFRDGADLEDTGREPRPTTVNAVFFGDGYLARLTKLRQEADKGKTGPFVHPLFGVWQCKVQRVSVDHEHSRRDLAAVVIQLLEDGTNSRIPDVASITAAETELNNTVAKAETTASNLPSPAPAEVAAATTDANTFIDDLQETSRDPSIRLDQLNAACAGAITALEESEDLTDVESWQLTQDIYEMQYYARQAKEAFEMNAPTILPFQIDSSMPMVAVAHRLYKDADRVDDLLRLNQIRNPFIVPSGKLKVHGS